MKLVGDCNQRRLIVECWLDLIEDVHEPKADSYISRFSFQYLCNTVFIDLDHDHFSHDDNFVKFAPIPDSRLSYTTQLMLS